MQADPRRHINPSRPHGQLPHSSLTVYDSTLAIKGGSCILGCFGAGEAGGPPPTGRGTELAEQLVIH